MLTHAEFSTLYYIFHTRKAYPSNKYSCTAEFFRLMRLWSNASSFLRKPRGKERIKA